MVGDVAVGGIIWEMPEKLKYLSKIRNAVVQEEGI